MEHLFPDIQIIEQLSIISLKLSVMWCRPIWAGSWFHRKTWIGKLGELLIYNSALSDSEISKVEGYLAHKWGRQESSFKPLYNGCGHLENVSSGQTSMGLSGLSSAIQHSRAGNNSAGSRLSDIISFTTGSVPNPPALSVSNPTVVGNTTATTKGNLLSFDGTTRPSVTLYYGTSDGNQTPANWNGTSSPVSLSTKPIGSLDHNLTGLSTGTTYFYRYFATVTISGTAYSSFSDLALPPLLPTVQTLAVSPISNPVLP